MTKPHFLIRLNSYGYLNNGAVTGEYSDKLDQAVNSVKQSEERRHEYVVTMIREREIREDTREEERRKVALNLRRMGMSDEMIAKALQVPQSIVREWLSDGEGQ